MRWSISERQEFRVPLTPPYPHPIPDVVPTCVSMSVCVRAGLGRLCWSSVAVTDRKWKAKPAIALPNPTTPGGAVHSAERCAICSICWTAIAQPMPGATGAVDSISGLHLEGAVGKHRGIVVTVCHIRLFQVVAALCVWLDVPAPCFLSHPLLFLPRLSS